MFFLSKYFSSPVTILGAGIFAAGLLGAQATFAGQDGKIASSAICEGMSNAGRSYLEFFGSILTANGKDVTVVCPIMRDVMNGTLDQAYVRLKRPSGDIRRISGKLYSCDLAYGGCFSQTTSTDRSNTYTSLHLNPINLRQGANQTFFFRFVLPDQWKIVAVGWTEKD